VKSPCFECDLKNSDKNNPTCNECKKRTDYIEYLEGTFHVSLGIPFKENRPTLKLLRQTFPNATAAQLGLPECKIPGCPFPIHAAGFCLNCYVANWRTTNPQKYKTLRKKQHQRRKQCGTYTLQLDFRLGGSLGRRTKKKDATSLLNDLTLIAEEEMRPTTTQAMIFIREGIRQWKAKNIITNDTTLERKKGILKHASKR